MIYRRGGDFMRLPSKDSSTFRGLITTAQGFVASFSALALSLWAAIGAVPGCPEAIIKFVYDNLLIIAGGFGISTGVVSFAWNVLFRKDVKNY